VKKQRKHYMAEEEVTILRRRLVEKVAVSDLCEELSLQPTVFYRWQKEFLMGRNGGNSRGGARIDVHQDTAKLLERLM
jgi:transposase